LRYQAALIAGAELALSGVAIGAPLLLLDSKMFEDAMRRKLRCKLRQEKQEGLPVGGILSSAARHSIRQHESAMTAGAVVVTLYPIKRGSKDPSPGVVRAVAAIRKFAFRMRLPADCASQYVSLRRLCRGNEAGGARLKNFPCPS